MDLTHSPQPLLSSDASEYFVWEPAGKKIAIQLGGDVVDQLNFEIMRGFGAVPKRGAEVGGLLLGTVEKGDKRVVRIEECVNIPCEHLHGPSFILSDSDLPALDRELAGHAVNSNGPLHVVGFFRSNTRELLQLSDDDLTLLDARFPDADAICLLVRPFTTRPSEAVFLTREDGRFSTATQSGTFVFRRREMHLAPAPRREGRPTRSSAPPPALDHGEAPDFLETGRERATGLDVPRIGRRRYGRGPHPVVVSGVAGQAKGRTPEVAADWQLTPSGPDVPGLPRDSAPPVEIPRIVRPAPAKPSRWGWAPLCCLFLVLGILTGAGTVLTMNRTHGVAPNEDPYAVGLGVSRFGESFHLWWNPQSQVLRQARSGELLIEEGGASKTQQLSRDDLSRGGIVYRGAAAPVRFRLTLFLRDRAAFSETVETQSPAR